MTPINPILSSFRINQVTPNTPDAPSLPLSVIEKIVGLSFEPTDAASRVALKAVSQDFRDIDISAIRRDQWATLLEEAPSGTVDIAAEMDYIERTFEPNPLDPIDRYTHLFRRLMSVFHSFGVPMERGSVLKTSPTDYQQLQSSLESNQLKLCWPEMKRKISIGLGCNRCFYRIPADDADPLAIRSFLAKKSVKRAADMVHDLQLNNLGLLSLPQELTLFTNIRELNLMGNQFLSLPTRSFQKTIGDPLNQRIPAFFMLETLLVSSSDRFPSLPFRGVRAIPSISAFPSLTDMQFDIPTLKSVSSIDSEWRANPLHISLAGSAVHDYMMDNEYRLSRTHKIDSSIINHLRSYDPTSPLGQLYHTILYTDATMANLQQQLRELSESDRNLIYYSIWQNSPMAPIEVDSTDWGRQHCFDDEHLLRKCVGLSIQEKFMQIKFRDLDRSRGELNSVYQNLWDQFMDLQTHFDETWITAHLFDNFSRLADAMSHIQVEAIEVIIYENYWQNRLAIR